MAVHGGFGTTITFADSGFQANVKLRGGSLSGSRSNIDVSHNASPSVTTGAHKQGFREFTPGMADPGTSSFDVLIDTALFKNPLVDGKEVITLAFPASGESTNTADVAASFACEGYCDAHDFDTPMDNEPISGSMSIKWSGVPTYTLEALV